MPENDEMILTPVPTITMPVSWEPWEPCNGGKKYIYVCIYTYEYGCLWSPEDGG